MWRRLSSSNVYLWAIVLPLLALRATSADDPILPIPLCHAHAHNDYEHKRPLYDALDCGFCSIEADVFLIDGKLLVGHTLLDLRPERTLEKLYLEPLRQRAKTHGGKIYLEGPPFFLLIDVKSEAKTTCAAVHEALARYSDLFTMVENSKVDAKAVTAVFSGNRDRAGIAAQKRRFAGLDGRPADLDSNAPPDLIPWISDSWSSHFQWKGDGPMPAEERAKLRDFVGKAHAHRRLVRFWGTPEKQSVWEEERAAGVDLLNTDKLAELRAFFTSRAPGKQ